MTHIFSAVQVFCVRSKVVLFYKRCQYRVWHCIMPMMWKTVSIGRAALVYGAPRHVSGQRAIQSAGVRPREPIADDSRHEVEAACRGGRPSCGGRQPRAVKRCPRCTRR